MRNYDKDQKSMRKEQLNMYKHLAKKGHDNSIVKEIAKEITSSLIDILSIEKRQYQLRLCGKVETAMDLDELIEPKIGLINSGMNDLCYENEEIYGFFIKEIINGIFNYSYSKHIGISLKPHITTQNNFMEKNLNPNRNDIKTDNLDSDYRRPPGLSPWNS